MRDILFVACIIFTSLISSASADPNSQNGFNLDGALVPVEKILSGGPPKDGIPAIDKPVFLKANKAKEVRDSARVLGITRNGVSKAYPISIMNYHEIVNDRFVDEAIAVTYCPLCGSGVAFKTEVTGYQLQFGVSGLLYNSDVLLYDRRTNSLWSQLLSKAITGPLKGNELTRIPIEHTTWADWRTQNPDTLVLSQDTGYRRDYKDNPYAGYDEHEGVNFPVSFRAQGYHPKEQVLGIQINNQAKAYPFVELAKAAKQNVAEIQDEVAGQLITVRFDTTHRAAKAYDAEGKQIAGTTLYWFAWFTFNPKTAVFKAK